MRCTLVDVFSSFEVEHSKPSQKFGFIKRVDKSEITTVKDLES